MRLFKNTLIFLICATLCAMALISCASGASPGPGAAGSGGSASQSSGAGKDGAPTTGAPTASPPTAPTVFAEAPATIRVGGLKGPTTIGMVKLIADSEAGATANKYEFKVAGAADELTPLLAQGGLDIAAIPINLASVLYNNTNGGIRLLAVNTLGVTYIVQAGDGDQIESVSDLRGKTIYCTGKGSVPEYALRYLLEQNGLNPDKDVSIEWKSEPPEVVAILSQSGGVAMLPQPYVTVAQGALPDLRIAINMTEAWDKLNNGSTLITGGLVGRQDFIGKYPALLSVFLDEYKASTEYVNANLQDAAALVENVGIVKAAVAVKAIPYCNIVYMEGKDMRDAAGGYLKVLHSLNPKAVGGKLPESDFYFSR